MTTPSIDLLLFRLSTNTNSFGLHSHWLMARDGRVWEVAAYRGGGAGLIGATALNKVVSLSATSEGSLPPQPHWALAGAELPRDKPAAPELAAQLWGGAL